MRGRATADAWPPDLVLSLQPVPRPFLFLLFARDAWLIDVDPNLPELAPPPDVGRSVPPTGIDDRDLTMLWLAGWDAAVEDYEAMPLTGPPPLEGAWSRLRRSWPEGLDEEAYRTWVDGVARERARVSVQEDAPERAVLPAIIAASSTGLDSVSELPLSGPFSRRVSARHLIVSSVTRHDAGLYAAALSGSE